MGRGSRPVIRWAKDRQRKKKDRERRKVEAAAPPTRGSRAKKST
jgi:hypothetical protein